MKLEPLIVYSLFSGALFSSLSLILSPQIHPAHKIGLSLGLALSFIYQTQRLRLSRWFFNSGAILALGSSLIYGVWFAEYPIQAAIYFLGYLVLIRMCELDASRDYKLALILSLFEIAAGSLMMVQFRYLLIFLGWLISALFSLTLITLSAKTTTGKILPSPGRLLSLLAGAGMASLIIGFFLFFLLPRVGMSLINFQLGSGRGWSGYSTEIRLGEVVSLLVNQTPVMRARLLDYSRPVEGLKWRMRAMEYYDKNTWRERSGEISNFPVYYNQPTTIDETPPQGRKLEQEIYLEPDLGSDLPAAGWVYAYQVPFKFRSLNCSSNHYCSLPVPSAERIHYLAYSALPQFSEQEMRISLSLMPEVLKDRDLKWVNNLLQLPKGSESICEMAQKIAGEESDPVRKISLIQDFFSANFRYSLTGLPTGPNPMEEFLYRSRRGNCEYFASAGALMLRCLGIPSRIAVGFLAGEFNPYQKYYLVRESDAHAWVEIYLPGLGFMEFDPTPPEALGERTKSTWLWKMVDPFIFRWNRWVVEFSVTDQIRGFRRVKAEGYRLRYNFHFTAPGLRQWVRGRPLVSGAILLSALAAVLISFLLSPTRRAERAWMKNLSWSQRQAARVYLDLLKLLGTRGYPRNPAATGLELAEKYSGRPEARQLILAVTVFYYRARFGREAALEENLKQAEADLDRLKRIILSGE